jgi:hypothetical protein
MKKVQLTVVAVIFSLAALVTFAILMLISDPFHLQGLKHTQQQTTTNQLTRH